MSVTLHDVAQAADVSIKTVSNVVRGQGNFSQATKERVERAIEKLGYRPNLAARGLRSGRLGVIGLVVPDIRNPYFAELADAVMRVSAEHDLLVVIEQSDGEQATELELLRGRATRMMDGVLFSVFGLSDAPTELTDSIIKPVVILGEPVPGWATDYVSMNDREGVRNATAHLLEQGRRRLAVLGAQPQERVSTAQLRLAGYRDALDAAQVPYDPTLVVDIDFWGRAQGADAIRGLLAAGTDFDAVVAFNDALALGAMRALEQAGLAVPGQIAVTGFDDIEDSRYSAPTLTTVRPDVRDIAHVAVQYLRDRIDEQDPRAVRGHRAQCALEVRQSTTLTNAGTKSEPAVVAGTTSDLTSLEESS